jgi:hypothetical protein
VADTNRKFLAGKGDTRLFCKTVPTRQLPNWLVRVAAMRGSAVKQILPELHKMKNGVNEKAERMLVSAKNLVRPKLGKDSTKKAA